MQLNLSYYGMFHAYFTDGWWILFWQISRHMSLSMHIVNENGGFNFGKRCKNHQIRQN